jgi:hypothetical protein
VPCSTTTTGGCAGGGLFSITVMPTTAARARAGERPP